MRVAELCDIEVEEEMIRLDAVEYHDNLLRDFRHKSRQ